MKTAALVSLLLLQLLQIPGFYAELRTSPDLMQCLDELGHNDVIRRIEECPEKLPTCTIAVTLTEIKEITKCGKIIGQIKELN